MPLAAAPTAMPVANRPSAQPTRLPRCSRQARPSRAVQQPPGGGCAGPGRDQALAQVAAGGQPVGQGAEADRGDGQRGQRGPPVPGERAGLLGPAHRRQPGQPLRPAAPAESPMPRSTKLAPSTAMAIPRAARGDPLSWAVTAATAAKASPQPPAATRVGGRAGHGHAEHDRDGGQQHGHDQAGRRRDAQGGGQRGMPADGGRAGQLQPARLLVGPGVPDDQEDAHQRRAQRAVGQVPPGDQRAQRGAVQLPVQERQGRVAGHAGHQRVPPGRRRVQLLQAERHVGRRDGQDVHPGGQHDPVPAQGQPGQVPGPGQVRAARRAGRARPGAAAVAVTPGLPAPPGRRARRNHRDRGSHRDRRDHRDRMGRPDQPRGRDRPGRQDQPRRQDQAAGAGIGRVVPQEQLLQRRRPADQAAHPGRNQPAQQRAQAGRVHLARQPHRPPRRRLDRDLVQPVQAGQVRGGIQLGGDRGPGQVAQLGQGPALHRPPGPDDRHPVAQRLDLGQDVAGQQDRPAAPPLVPHAVPERRLHQRVQPGRGLVQDQQLAVRGQGGDQRHLLPVAGGVGAGLLGRVQPEPLDQAVPAGRVQPAAQPAEQVDDLAAGQAGPQRHVAGHVGQPPVQRHRLAPGVAAQQPGRAAARPEHAEQDPDGGGLARAVRPRNPCTSPAATPRSSPSSATVRP